MRENNHVMYGRHHDGTFLGTGKGEMKTDKTELQKAPAANLMARNADRSIVHGRGGGREGGMWSRALGAP